jgi:hypothetical protein
MQLACQLECFGLNVLKRSVMLMRAMFQYGGQRHDGELKAFKFVDMRVACT